MEPAAVVLILLIAGVTTILLWSLNMRYRRRELEHKERLAALERGVPLPPLDAPRQAAPWTPRLYLLRGMIWLFCGISLMAAISAIALTVKTEPSMEQKVWRATYLRSGGATEDEIKLFLNEPTDRNRPPIGLALLGLIPAGVGLAYLVFYGVERKNLLS